MGAVVIGSIVKFKNFCVYRFVLLGVCLLAGQWCHAQMPLTLEQAVALASQNDPWLTGSESRQKALLLRGEAAAELPDPMVSLGVANLPTDTLDLDQEAMTQVKVGVTQAFPRGATRALTRQHFDTLGSQQEDLRVDRMARSRWQVSLLWLEAFQNSETVRLIEKDRALFEYLVDVADSSYRSAAGKTRQQDLVRAQLELTRLEDRLVALRARREAGLARLSEWLPGPGVTSVTLSDQLPDLMLVRPDLVFADQPGKEQVTSLLSQHPAIRSLDKSISASATTIELARQEYKPQWSLNSSYAHRQDDPQGNDRSDFFSVGVTVAAPLFGSNRQDKNLEAAIAETEAVKTEKALMLRRLYSNYEAASRRLVRLNERIRLYTEVLLNEVDDQAEASLSAYTSNEGNFADVVRARIAELDANIDFLGIRVDRLKTIAELNYLLAANGKAAGAGDPR